MILVKLSWPRALGDRGPGGPSSFQFSARIEVKSREGSQRMESNISVTVPLELRLLFSR